LGWMCAADQRELLVRRLRRPLLAGWAVDCAVRYSKHQMARAVRQEATRAPIGIQPDAALEQAGVSGALPRAGANPPLLLGSANQLRTPRLDLRLLSADDADGVLEALVESRESLMRWVPDIGRRQTADEVRLGLDLLDRAHNRGERLVYGLWHRATGRFVGETGLYDVSGSRCTVGYWLRVTARGHGFVDEALSALERHAFRVLGLNVIEAHIAPDNVASRRVVDRHGYEAIGARMADASGMARQTRCSFTSWWMRGSYGATDLPERSVSERWQFEVASQPHCLCRAEGKDCRLSRSESARSDRSRLSS